MGGVCLFHLRYAGGVAAPSTSSVTTALCPTAGILAVRGAALERAAARVCRDAGARVATNVMLRDMNVEVPPADGRRIEVLATTFVSPIARDGMSGVPLTERWGRRRGGRCEEAAGELPRTREWPAMQTVMGLAVGGRFGAEGALPPLDRLTRRHGTASLGLLPARAPHGRI